MGPPVSLQKNNQLKKLHCSDVYKVCKIGKVIFRCWEILFK